MIHNGQLRGIASRAIDASARATVVNDLIRIYAFARRDQGSFHWVTIDESLDLPGSEIFDPVKMAELYEVGYKAALAGPVWSVEPPLLQTDLP